MMLASYDLLHWDLKKLSLQLRLLPYGFTGQNRITGGLAQLARALDLHSRGHRFDSDILHISSFEFVHFTTIRSLTY